MNKFNRTLAGVMVILTIFLMGAAPYESFGPGERVVFTAGGYTRTVQTQSETVLELLDELGVYIHRFDRVTPPFETPIHAGMTIEIERSYPVYIQLDDNEPVVFYVRPGAAVVTIAADFARDTSTNESYQFHFAPELTRHRPMRGETVHLQTIEWKTVTEYELLEFERVYIESFLVPVGEFHVYREGQVGWGRRIYQTEYISGVQVDKTLLISDYYSRPLEEIVHMGVALPEGMAISACGVVFSYSRLILMESTAYTLSEACTGRHPSHPLFGVTASGMMAQRGIVAVDTNVIPFHTQMYIEGYGFAVAGDRGGAIRGYKVDVFMDSMAEARQWGRRHGVRVWIIE